VKNFGNVKTDYIIVQGSIQGPAKRQLLITSPLRKSKKQIKKNFEFIEVIK
jgi:ribosomal protein L3